MGTFVSNRNGTGLTDEQGHYRFQTKVWLGNVLNGLGVKQNSPLARNVLVPAGDIKIDYGEYAYTAWNDADVTVSINTADTSNPRLDRIVAYIDRNLTSGGTNNPNYLKFMAIPGTPGAVPSKVSDVAAQAAVTAAAGGVASPWAELAVVRVEANATTIPDSKITDTRVFVTPKVPINTILASSVSELINAGMQVAQRSPIAAPTISTAYQYGWVDRWAAKATGTAVTAGTITQSSAPNVGSTGYALRLNGVTVTGTGKVFVRYRMESRDAKRFKNKAASLSFKMWHDVGSTIPVLVTLRKPTVADNFASTTAIVSTATQNVPTGTETLLKFEQLNSTDLGDVSNGLEIEIEVQSGAITTKNFEFCEMQFVQNTIAPTWRGRTYESELAACLRYFYPVVYNSSGYYSTLGSAYIGGGQSWIGIPLSVALRATPTVVMTNAGVRFGGADYGYTFSSVTQQSAGNLVLQVNSGGTGNGNSGTGWLSPGGTLTFDAEL